MPTKAREACVWGLVGNLRMPLPSRSTTASHSLENEVQVINYKTLEPNKIASFSFRREALSRNPEFKTRRTMKRH